MLHIQLHEFHKKIYGHFKHNRELEHTKNFDFIKFQTNFTHESPAHSVALSVQIRVTPNGTEKRIFALHVQDL